MRPILVVEDCDNDVELLMIALEQNRIDNPVVRVHDGQEALDYLRCEGEYADQPQPDPEFLLLDIKMPRVNGLEVLAAIRESSALRRLPVIALTASREDKDLARAYELGINGYVVKPVNLDEFIAAVQSIGDMWSRHNQVPPEFRER